MMPPIQCYDDLFGSYFDLCAELGLQNRFTSDGVFYITPKPLPYTIYVDTREQKPLEFQTRHTERKTLKFGDYACSDHAMTCLCYIERKSPQDFFGTFSGGVSRFCRELDRAVEAKGYVVVLVEETLRRCQDMQSQCLQHEKRRRANSEFVMHNVRDIIQKYSNIQFLFVNGREKAAEIVEKIFDSNCSYQTVDLQFWYDIGKI